MHKHTPVSLIFLALVIASGCMAPIATSQPSENTQVPAISATAMTPTDVTVTIGPADGLIIKPLLGVNAGPLPAGDAPVSADLTASYQQLGINLIRTHDFYQALNMSVMYPDMTADPFNAQSYNFSESDRIWKSIINGGFEPYFRLGDSYTDSTPPANPTERANWVKAALEVLKHYRTGKWNGFNTSFRYVEIWNEPDNQQFWPKPHNALEYYQLYSEASLAIKHEFPELNVGGPAVTQATAMLPQGQKWAQDFLNYVSQKKCPLDFFSWHMYSNVPQEYADANAYFRSALDSRGFTQTPTHITEWNTNIKRNEDKSSNSIALRSGSQGAAIISAAWIELQNQPMLEVATFYRGNDTNIDNPTFYGLHYADGRPKQPGSAFSLWHRIVQYPQRLTASISSKVPVWVLAGKNSEGKTALLVVNTGNKKLTSSLEFTDQQQIGKFTTSKVTGSGIQTSEVNGSILTLDGYSVQFIEFN